jgi:soluble lytic murein transglycosylase-like protein
MKPIQKISDFLSNIRDRLLPQQELLSPLPEDQIIDSPNYNPQKNQFSQPTTIQEMAQPVQVRLQNFVPKQYAQTVLDAAKKYDINPQILAAKIMAESSFRPDVISPANAQGISQIMPTTADEIRRLNGEFDPFIPEQAIPAGAFYLDRMRRQIGREGTTDEDWFEALKAYNAGAGNYRKYNGNIPFKETMNYIPKIQKFMSEEWFD